MSKYSITCANTVFHLDFGSQIISYKPTGKYRFYESGEMTIEFEVSYEKQGLFWTVCYTKKKFINEAFISFPLPYKEFNSNAN